MASHIDYIKDSIDSSFSLEQQLAQLNEAQHRAVVHAGSPLLILAGPGSGKTKVITTKVAWLIEEANVTSNKILAMTFTNKAAKEMRKRVQNSIQRELNYFQQPCIRTFHSFGAYVLRLFYEQAALPLAFQIYDISDQKTLIREVLPSVSANKAEEILRKILFVKERGLFPQSQSDIIEEIKLDRDHYKAYEDAKQKTGNVDFADLLLKPYLLLKEHEEVRNVLRTMWDWYLVDEYQDTNPLQSLLLNLLCKHTTNICVVGDDDQSIYKFRGAVVENILTFTQYFSPATLICLEENYRSTNQILQLANNVVSQNEGRHQKDIFSSLQDAEKPELLSFVDEFREQQYIVDFAQKAIESGKNLGIFFRLNAFSRKYETALVKTGIPHEIVGAISFYEREEVKNALTLLRVLRNKYDFVSLKRIINVPTRGIGSVSVKKIIDLMQEGYAWDTIINEPSVLSLFPKKVQEGMLDFQNIFDSINDKSIITIGDCLETLLEKSGLKEHYKEIDIRNGSDRIQNLEELISFASEFKNAEESWNDFFEQIALVEQGVQNQNASVYLMSLHRSKGLEFDMVLICGVEEGTLPYERDSEVTDFEEERRLFYVGITRAKTHLVISYCMERRRYGFLQRCTPSSFLHQIDTSLVQDRRHTRRHTRQESYTDESYTDDTYTNDSVSLEGEWEIGQKVQHDDYGIGYVKQVKQANQHLVVEVEFTDDYEALFIPKYTPKLRKASKETSTE